MLVESGRIRVAMSTQRWLEEALMEPRVQVEPITPAIAVRSLDVGRVLKRDPADHLIAATALVLNCSLVTADDALASFPGLPVTW